MGSLVDTEKLAEYGFDPADKTFTWDDLIALGEKVHAADSSQYLCCVDSKQAALYYARVYLRQLTGKQFINDDGTVGAVSYTHLGQAAGSLCIHLFYGHNDHDCEDQPPHFRL